MDEYLTGRRAAQPGFVEPSFPTIAGAGANGAIIHYRAQPDGCARIDGGTMLLVDSGAPQTARFYQVLAEQCLMAGLVLWDGMHVAHVQEGNMPLFKLPGVILLRASSNHLRANACPSNTRPL